jgi:hypothetical protein
MDDMNEQDLTPASPAAPQESKSEDKAVWRCNIHGDLPLTAFYASDRQRNRHRCKLCANGDTFRWRKKQSADHYRLWNLFIRRCKRKLSVSIGWTWAKHGRKRLQELVNQLPNREKEDLRRWRLSWKQELTHLKRPPPPSKVDDLILCSRFRALQETETVVDA